MNFNKQFILKPTNPWSEEKWLKVPQEVVLVYSGNYILPLDI